MMIRRKGNSKFRSIVSRGKGGWCPCCGGAYDYICEDCGKCRWCCSC